MVNVHALQEIIPVIRELAAQQRFNMMHWAEGPVNPHAASYQECGTQFCLAGAKAAADGWRPQYEIFYDEDDKALYSATGKFVRPQDRHESLRRYGYEASDIAEKGFGLTYEQAVWLFHATHIRDVEHMVTRIEWLISNPGCDDPVEEYPQELLDAEYDTEDAY